MKTLPGANIDSENNLLEAEGQKVKSNQKSWEEEIKIDFEKNQE